ncbi:hypothetical protein GTV15_19465 [Streptomyces sp. SID7803]|nr:hypothetical protein [Streptomyces sp. SID7803]
MLQIHGSAEVCRIPDGVAEVLLDGFFHLHGKTVRGRGVDAAPLPAAGVVPSDVWFEQPALKAVTARTEAMPPLPSDFSFIDRFPVAVRRAAAAPTIPSAVAKRYRL